MARKSIHGKWSRLRQCHYDMLRRCYNPKKHAYARYGGRGITVCQEWHDFGNFSTWALTHGYESHLTLDRIDNDKDYEPANCRWATLKEQSYNTRRNWWITAFNETKTISQWVADPRCVVTLSALQKRFAAGCNIEDSITVKCLQKLGRGDAKLSPETAREAHLLVTKEGKTQIEVAKIMNVSPHTISSLITGQTWRELGLTPFLRGVVRITDVPPRPSSRKKANS